MPPRRLPAALGNRGEVEKIGEALLKWQISVFLSPTIGTFRLHPLARAQAQHLC
jgi:hypothetical protein